MNLWQLNSAYIGIQTNSVKKISEFNVKVNMIRRIWESLLLFVVFVLWNFLYAYTLGCVGALYELLSTIYICYDTFLTFCCFNPLPYKKILTTIITSPTRLSLQINYFIKKNKIENFQTITVKVHNTLNRAFVCVMKFCEF